VIDCTLVTCEAIPLLDPDDRLLHDELESRGLRVGVAAWSDASVDWSASALCVLRSTWDYHRRWDDFSGWLATAQSATAIRNDPRLVSWNAHKSYISVLEAAGVRVVPTVWASRGAAPNLVDVRAQRGWRDVVLKPARGASAHDVERVFAAQTPPAAAQALLDRLASGDEVLIQPYLRSVHDYGERALIFLDGRYSHAVLKKPFDTILSIDGDPSSAVEATVDEVKVATRALDAVPGKTLYARVDLLRDDEHRACVSELEVIEPALYLAVNPRSRVVLADAIEGELSSLRKGAAL
jgi:glutathione synthase/RimK-type ligase-like ATP-grasp enzyme